MKSVAVVGAIILNDHGEILLTERPPGKHLAGLWEFPGGKIEAGESSEQALKRELMEELELPIQIQSNLGIYPFRYETVSIQLHVFVVKPMGSPVVTEFVQKFKWINPHQIDPKALAPADVEPLIRFLETQDHSPGKL